jgi:hypothetical protein
MIMHGMMDGRWMMADADGYCISRSSPMLLHSMRAAVRIKRKRNESHFIPIPNPFKSKGIIFAFASISIIENKVRGEWRGETLAISIRVQQLPAFPKRTRPCERHNQYR